MCPNWDFRFENVPSGNPDGDECQRVALNGFPSVHKASSDPCGRKGSGKAAKLFPKTADGMPQFCSPESIESLTKGTQSGVLKYIDTFGIIFFLPPSGKNFARSGHTVSDQRGKASTADRVLRPPPSWTPPPPRAPPPTCAGSPPTNNKVRG
jgi:hypothetical protein